MKNTHVFVVMLLNVMVFRSAYAEGICKENKVAIFSCELKKSTASLCEAKNTGILTCRHGVGKKIDLEVSDDGPHQGRVFYFSNVPYAGGGEAHIRFSRGGYSYYLYDKTVKAGKGADFSAGIVVYLGNKKISNVICQNDASIHQQAYTDITKERYKNIGYK